MRTIIIVSVTAIGIVAASSLAADRRASDAERGQWLSIQQVLAKVESVGYRDIEKVEREGGTYEVKATDRSGLRMKLYLHPKTGEIVAQQQRDPKGKSYDSRRGENHRRDAGDCNRRRCRDDVPPVAGAVSNATN
jgi:hypothetical protein